MASSNQSSPHFAHLFRQITWEELDPGYINQLISLALLEDLQGVGLKNVPTHPGDATTDALPLSHPGQAQLIARQPMTLCGIHLVANILAAYGGDATFTALRQDGAQLQTGDVIGTLRGTTATLLKAERVILNFLQHLSGIATQAARYSALLADSQTVLLDTRKTTPGLRMLEKYAVACGGGWNHRLGLFDRVMLKDNHLASSGAHAGQHLADAVRLAHKRHPNLAIEVEVDHIDQIQPILQAGADVILLDNFSIAQLEEAIALIGNQAYTEASGGITLQTLPELAQLGLDFISCGALIHQSQWQDIGMDWMHAQP